MTDHDDITRLQESQLFIDRRLDELHEAVLDVAARLQRAVDQLARLEARLDALDDVSRDAAPEDIDDDSPAGLS